MLVRMLRGYPDLILDSCSVLAKRGGDLTGPNSKDRAKKGSKYHVATTGDRLPVACAVTGANVPDTVLFERLSTARAKHKPVAARRVRTKGVSTAQANSVR